MVGAIGHTNDRVEHKAEIVRVDEFRCVATTHVVPTEDRHQRLAVPHDVEALVEQQRQFALFAADRADRSSPCILHTLISADSSPT